MKKFLAFWKTLVGTEMEVANEEAGMSQLLDVWICPLLSGHFSLSDLKFVRLQCGLSTLVIAPCICISNTLVSIFTHYFY